MSTVLWFYKVHLLAKEQPKEQRKKQHKEEASTLGSIAGSAGKKCPQEGWMMVPLLGSGCTQQVLAPGIQEEQAKPVPPLWVFDCRALQASVAFPLLKPLSG